LIDQHGSVTGSDSAEPDPVVAAQQWMTQRGLPLPVAEPVNASPVDPPAGSVRGEPKPLTGEFAPVGTTFEQDAFEQNDFEQNALEQDDRHAGSPRTGRAERGAGRGKGPDQRSRRSGPALTGPPENPEETARGVVLRKLTGQSRSRHELNQALKAKQVPEAVAHQVLNRMEEVGLVDDAAFAREWVESRQQRRQLSRRALRHELQTKGVDREQIENALSTVDGGDELVAALALAERKLRSMAGLTREVQYRRLAGALARRGFSGGVTGQVISQVLDGVDR